MPRRITWVPRTCAPISRRGAASLWRALVLGLAGLAPLASAAPAVGAPFSPDRILIIPKAGHDIALANQHATERVKVRKKFPALGNIHVLNLPKGSDPEAIVERYRRNGHVESADLDRMGWHPAAIPNDPGFLNGTQWHLNNLGSTPTADLDAPAAWDFLRSASNIIVATIDTGARLTHQDLAANLYTNPGEIPGDGIDNDGNGYIDDVHGINVLQPANSAAAGDPTDDYGHGSHVAGILGAVGNNGVGVCGVAWNVRILPVKFFSPSNPSDSDVVEALDYARARGAKVVNFSFVAPTSTPTLSNGFWNLQNADIVLCAAAGNSGMDNDVTPIYPASYRMPNIVSVTATDNTDALWSLSNYGATSVHLAAPGVDIYSTYNGSDSDYNYLSGTSMAAPMVSGSAALLRARFPNESSAQIVRRILNSVDVLPGLAGRCVTGGRLNLRKALDFATLPMFTITNAPYDWIPTNGMASMSFANNDSVNGPFALPFSFPFYGRSYTQIWVGANGLLGVTNTGLTLGVNGNIPGTNTPNAMYPFWDDLNPIAGGSVWFGVIGVSPNRKAVASWVAVPHNTTSGGPFTFQAILHESGHVAFQYDQVSLGQQSFTNGRSATVGIEDPTGLFATRYRDVAVPTFFVTNNQALLFTPQAAPHPAPGLRIESGPAPGQSRLTLSGEPLQPGALLFSTNLVSWSMVYSNLLPASGLAIVSQTNSAPQKFYRAISGPFLP